MTDTGAMSFVAPDDARAVAAVVAIRTGDHTALADLFRDEPGLASIHIGTEAEARSLLHVATDWPGHFPGVGETIAALVEAGADVDARFVGVHGETPLHWAASSDDVDALDALLDAGADIEATGAVIGGGTALSDACAFGQWHAARRLVERGARAGLWEAASLGLLERLDDLIEADSPSAADLTQAFWCACHGGQANTAARLHELGADVNWVGYDDLTAIDAAERSGAAELVVWLRSMGARRAADL